MPWEDIYQRIVDRRYQEESRPRGFIPEDHFSFRPSGESEGIRVRSNGRFNDQTGLRFIGFDFRIGG